ncbi:MAG: serine/threonine-protein phosphatase [Chloroflexi bacterium]|nr:serine/threonine-protein phosphatase [Chloroflexota bacterium]
MLFSSTNLQLDIGHRTDVGRKRDQNEDCLGIYRPDRSEEVARRGTLLVVADGMGGYAAGEIASRASVETVIGAYYGDLSGGVEETLVRALRLANDRVREEANRDAARTGMGSTIVVAAIRGSDLVAANVGDARAYLVRHGRTTQISHDHSWVAEMVAEGQITLDEARYHPMRHVVTRSLGGTPEVNVELYPRIRLQESDVAILCSDGLWGAVSPEKIAQDVQSKSAQAAADMLVAAANEAGGPDNITAVVCRVLAMSVRDAARTRRQDALQLQDTQPLTHIESQSSSARGGRD